MGELNDAARAEPSPVELQLPWGPVVRGLNWGRGPNQVFLLHEPGADLDAWGALPAQLASRLPLEVVAYDLPGHGLSDGPWEPKRLADLILALAGHEAGGRRRFVVAAGGVATVLLDLAEEMHLAGVILLSPTPDGSPVRRSPHVPKLLFAASLAETDIENARNFAASCGGWVVVTSVPVAASGTGMLATDWASRITDQAGVFLHDCIARSRNAAGKSRNRTAGTR